VHTLVVVVVCMQFVLVIFQLKITVLIKQISEIQRMFIC